MYCLIHSGDYLACFKGIGGLPLLDTFPNMGIGEVPKVTGRVPGANPCAMCTP